VSPNQRSSQGATPTVDDDTLAAFVEGVLDGEERARVIEAIARDPDTYRVFAESAAFVAEERAKPAGGRPTSGDDPASAGGARRAWWRTRRGAAGLALAAAVVLLVISLPLGSGALDAGALVERMALAPGDRVAGLVEESQALGFQAALSPTERALRLGALVVDLEVARRQGDEAGLRRAGTNLLELASPLGLSAGAHELLERAENGAMPDANGLARLERELRGLVGRSAFDAGRTLEAARIAEALGDRDFVEQPAVRRALRRAEGFAQ
jgi:hypothetical protein